MPRGLIHVHHSNLRSFLASPPCSFTPSGEFSRFFGVYFVTNVISNKRHHEGAAAKKSKKRGTRTREMKEKLNRMFRPENDASREIEVER